MCRSSCPHIRLRTKSKGILGTLAAIVLVVIIGTLFLVSSYFNIFSFRERIIRIVLREYLDTKSFSLLSSTVNKYPIFNLLGYGAILNQEVLDSPTSANLRQTLASRLSAIEKEANLNYLFYVNYAGKKYFEILSGNVKSAEFVSTDYIPLPYNKQSLIAEIKWAEWK